MEPQQKIREGKVWASVIISLVAGAVVGYFFGESQGRANLLAE